MFATASDFGSPAAFTTAGMLHPSYGPLDWPVQFNNNTPSTVRTWEHIEDYEARLAVIAMRARFHVLMMDSIEMGMIDARTV